MNKKKVLWVILDLVFVAIFNVFFFLLGGVEHNASVWLSYAFIHFAYLMVLVTPLLTKGNNAVTTGLPLYTISSAYFFVGLIAGVVFILISPQSIKPTLLVQLSIAALYIVILIINLLANEHTAELESNKKPEVAYIKNATNKVSSILREVSDKELKKKIEKIYDELSSSPTKTHPDMSQIESGICSSVEHLSDSLQDKKLALQLSDTILSRIQERNKQLKTLN
ncbi:hypothetical protein FACS1894188_08120 [Clostridia bacterium]|nr:hypothetical protein FACS1894188_08120 [Clostridia bacterium]